MPRAFAIRATPVVVATAVMLAAPQARGGYGPASMADQSGWGREPDRVGGFRIESRSDLAGASEV